MRSILLYIIIVSTSFLLFANSAFKNKSVFSLSGPTEVDALLQEKELVMYADPTTGKIPDNVRIKELSFYKQYIAPFQKASRGNPFRNIGPWNVGGRTRAMAFDKTNENIIIAGGVSSGLWRTTNGGISWTQTSNLAGYLGVTSVAQDTRIGKENIWYASTGEGSGNSASASGAYFFGDGLFKSTDSAKSWQPITSTANGLPNNFSIPLQISWRIATHPNVDSDYVFVANYGTIYRSNNGGNTFTTALGTFGASSAYYTDISITTTGIIYASISSDGFQKGFYRSADIGLTWANITPTNFNVHDRTVMGINPNNENEIYFFSYIPDSTNTWSTQTSNYKGSPEYISLLKYTYLASDGADTNGLWTNLSQNLPNNINTASAGPFDKLNCQGGYDMLVKVQPTTGHVFIAGTNIFRSTNAFTNPNNTTQIGGYKIGTTLPYFQIYENHHPDNHDLLFYPSNYKKILSASDGGVRMTIDGNSTSPVSWVNLNNGFITTQYYSINIDPTINSKWVLGGFQDNGNFLTTDYTIQNKEWVIPFNGDGAFNYIAPNRDFFVMSIQEGRVAKFKLDNNGVVLQYGRIDPIGPTNDDYVFINPLAVDPNDNNLLYIPAGKYLYRQDQLTALPMTNAWDSISTGWFKFSDTIKAANTNNGFKAQITAIAISKTPANTVYIGTSNADVYKILNANTNTASFVKINKAPMNGYVSSIAIDPDDSKKVIVAYSNYGGTSLHYSIDGGDTFKFCLGNLRIPSNNASGASPSVRCVKIMKTPGGGKKYFIGTSIGLYSTELIKANRISTKDSTIWTQESPNSIGTNIVTSIDVRPEDYMVVVGTHGAGGFISEQFFPTFINTNNKVSGIEMKLFPNPTKQTSNIQINVSQTSYTNIYLCDIFGRKLFTIAKGEIINGLHNFVIHSETLQAGNYIVVVENASGKKLSEQLSIQK